MVVGRMVAYLHHHAQLRGTRDAQEKHTRRASVADHAREPKRGARFGWGIGWAVLVRVLEAAYVDDFGAGSTEKVLSVTWSSRSAAAAAPAIATRAATERMA